MTTRRSTTRSRRRRRRGPTVGTTPRASSSSSAAGSGVFGSYAKVLLADDVPAAYAQFGPLSRLPAGAAHPRPVPGTARFAAAGGHHLHRHDRRRPRRGPRQTLVEAVCDDLAGRGFAAVETYPEADARPDATSAATPAFWVAVGFALAVDDERFPVMRRELD